MGQCQLRVAPEFSESRNHHPRAWDRAVSPLILLMSLGLPLGSPEIRPSRAMTDNQLPCLTWESKSPESPRFSNVKRSWENTGSNEMDNALSFMFALSIPFQLGHGAENKKM